MLDIEWCLSEQSFHCCDVSACIVLRSTSCVQHAPPLFSEHLHPSLVRQAVTDCTGCWVLNPGPWAYCTPEPHPQPLALFCKLGLGVRAKWPTLWSQLVRVANSRAHRSTESQKCRHISISLNSELSGHCWHLKPSCSKTIVWKFSRGFVPGRKQKTKICRLGCGLVGVPCSAYARPCVQTSVKKVKGWTLQAIIDVLL